MSAVRVVDVDTAVQARRSQNRARLLWVGAAGAVSLTLTVLPFAGLGGCSALALGQYISAHGLPPAEPFSYLPAAQPWVAQGWLHDVLLAGMVRAGGPALASVVTGILASLGLVLAALAVRPRARVPGGWLAAGVILAALVARPLLTTGGAVSLLGAGVVLHLLGRRRDGEDRALWLLPPAFLLWANLDGGFVAGLAIVLVAWLCATGSRAARRPLLLALAAGAGATLVNPYGPGVYGSLLRSALAPGAGLFSATFASPDFHDTWMRLFEVVAAVLVILWVAARDVDRTDLALGMGAVALALWSQQFVPLCAVIAAPQLGVYGHRASERTLASRMPRRIVAMASSLRARRGSGALLLAAVAVITAVGIARDGTPAAAAGAEASTAPQAAATRVAAAHPGERVYSAAAWGDYLAYRLPTGRVVFVYGSAGTFTDAAQTAYATIHLLQPGWEAAVRQYRIQVAVVDQRSQEAAALHELGWRVDCFDAKSGALVLVTPGVGGSTTPSSPLTVPPANAPAC